MDRLIRKVAFLVTMVFFVWPLKGVCGEGVIGDIDNDGRIGLGEVVYALQVSSNMRSEQGGIWQLLWKGEWRENKDYVPYDQPLHINQHPEYVKEEVMFHMTKQINDFIKKSKISKREIARRLDTSLSQLDRLLNTANYNKNLSRLLEIAAILSYEFNWSFKKAA